MKTVISLNRFSDADALLYDEASPIQADLGSFIREARLQKGLTQEELAQKCGTTKAYISKVENNIKDIRFSTLKKLVEQGLNGEINLTITL